tara:strand:- start:705 stop:1169 length:465 start_codon:yes stop_codon:yes gene_type:complete
MLNAKLADFAMNLEHAEEQIWDLWSALEGKAFDGDIIYPRSFSIQDKANDISVLKMAKDAKPTDPMIIEKIDKMILETITEKTYDEVKQGMMEEQQAQPLKLDMQHPPMESPEDMIKHMRSMVQEGYTDEQIMELHPEIKQFFGDTDGEETQGS